MRQITLIVLLLQMQVTHAQQDYTIEYTIVTGVVFDENNNATYQHKKYGTLYINADSLSFFKWEVQKSPAQKIMLEDKMSHHGIVRFLHTDSTYENCPIYGKSLLVRGDWSWLYNTNWEVFPDTLQVLDYTCTKAVNDSGVVAWFTPLIPVNSGPLSYHGLPGLILQVNDLNRKMVVSAKAITNGSASIVFPKKYAIMDVAEYKRFLDKYRPKDNFTVDSWSRYD